jgi:putative ABC transport system permease protein
MRTWLTILGMGVGTGAVVSLVGLGFGLQNIMLEQIVFGETLLSLNVSPPGSQTLELDDDAVAQFQGLQQVEDTAPRASYAALITYQDLTGNVMLQGVSPAFFRYAGIQMEEGEAFSEDEGRSASNEILITSAMLQLFEVDEPSAVIGETVSFRVFVPRDGGGEREVEIDKEYRIRGVTSNENNIAALMQLEELRRHIEIQTYDRVQVKVADNNSLDGVEQSIIDMGYNVSSLSETVEKANKIFFGMQVVLAAFGSIALIVSAIGMFNTMTVTLLERTGEIGIMRTQGASSTDIKILFIAESVIVGFLGGLAGIAIGGGVGIGLNTLLNFVASQFGGQAVTLFSFPPLFLVFIAVFSAVVGFLTGVFPARRAAALDPLDAIRYS